MADVGDIIEGTVEVTTSYGLFAVADGETYLLPLHELVWGRLRSPSEFASVGDRVSFKVTLVRYVDGKSTHLGSPKLAFPDQNPWRDPSVFAVGQKFEGVVVKFMSYGAFIRHPNGVEALLHRDSFDSENQPLHVGDTFDFIITESDANNQQIRVDLCS